jgi:hypothetical protein
MQRVDPSARSSDAIAAHLTATWRKREIDVSCQRGGRIDSRSM